MVQRFMATNGRIILSKPGFAVSTALADDNKIFDSNWDFSAVIIKSGEIADTAAQHGAVPQATDDPNPLVISFPDPGYIPCGYCVCERDAAYNYGSNAFSWVFTGFKSTSPVGGSKDSQTAYPYFTRTSIVIPRGISRDVSGAYTRWPLVRYVVFGITQ